MLYCGQSFKDGAERRGTVLGWFRVLYGGLGCARGMPPALFSSVTTEMAAPSGKRKTPSELRSEQLKRFQSPQDVPQDSANFQGSESKKGDGMVFSRPLVDTRVPDVYQSVKPGERFLPLRGKKDKADLSSSRSEATLNHISLAAKGRSDSFSLFSRKKNAPESAKANTQSTERGQEDLLADGEAKFHVLRSCSFRGVKEISNSQGLLRAESSIDMVEALKKLAPRKALGPFDPNMGLPLPSTMYNDGGKGTASNVPNRGSAQALDIESSLAWVRMNGESAPLDLSLKVVARFVSAESLHWCHRLRSTTQCEGLRQFTEPVGVPSREAERVELVACVGSSRDTDKLGTTFWRALHSWVHPQASLPLVVLSSLATGRGGDEESVFLSKRWRAWEDAFRSLYYTYCSRNCSLFYFCAQQFVAMFVGGGVGGRRQGACTAYMTRSTRGLRNLLGEQDIRFTMPFSSSEASTTTLEDLLDLSEFEKSNPGQTRLVDEGVASDNSPQSMLCFNGVSNVHRLYDFLLNHRSLLNYTAATDVPVLYAPVPFENASLTLPEMSCKQMQRIDGLTKPLPQDVYMDKETVRSNPPKESSSDMTYSMEIKGIFVPPWVVTRLCDVLQKSQQPGFTVRFTTEPLTEGLNIAQEVVSDPDKPINFKNFLSSLTSNTKSKQHSDSLPETKASCPSVATSELGQSSGLGTSVIKELKYEGGSYRAVLAPLQLNTSF